MGSGARRRRRAPPQGDRGAKPAPCRRSELRSRPPAYGAGAASSGPRRTGRARGSCGSVRGESRDGQTQLHSTGGEDGPQRPGVLSRCTAGIEAGRNRLARGEKNGADCPSKTSDDRPAVADRFRLSSCDGETGGRSVDVPGFLVAAWLVLLMAAGGFVVVFSLTPLTK